MKMSTARPVPIKKDYTGPVVITHVSALRRVERKKCIVCGDDMDKNSKFTACHKCHKKNKAPVSDDLLLMPKNGVRAIDVMPRPLKPPGRL
jgi:Class III cytochrome C family